MRAHDTFVNFREEADALLKLVNSYMEDKLLYIGQINQESFSILKTYNHSTDSAIYEGQTIPRSESMCQLVYKTKEPVIIENTRTDLRSSHIAIVEAANIGSYLGVPILMRNGTVFGTLCSISSTASKFTEKDVETFKGLAHFFSYALDLEDLASHDLLTGLCSRNYVYSHFDQKTADSKGTIMLLDLNEFKRVNEQYGHEIGDMVLRETANRIEEHLSMNDVSFRLGGDEFLIDFHDLVDTRIMQEHAEALLASMGEWYMFGTMLPLSASIGIVSYPKDAVDVQSLLTYADIALSYAKEKGESTYEFYQDFMK